MVKKAKKAVRKAVRRAPENKLDTILKQQERILKNEESIRKEAERIERLEEKEVRIEQQTLAEERKEELTQQEQSAKLAKIEAIQQEIKGEIRAHPLTRLSLKEIIKCMVGAFIGIVIHFTFIYSAELPQQITAARATGLLIITFLIICVFVYGTGFRKVKERSILWLLPHRIILIYCLGLIVTVATLWVFYPHFGAAPGLAYREVATVNLSAVIGACTADLIGRE